MLCGRRSYTVLGTVVNAVPSCKRNKTELLHQLVNDIIPHLVTYHSVRALILYFKEKTYFELIVWFSGLIDGFRMEQSNLIPYKLLMIIFTSLP